jgi:hypothetical protein
MNGELQRTGGLTQSKSTFSTARLQLVTVAPRLPSLLSHRSTSMSENELNELIEAVRLAAPTPEQREAQRRSFVYGNIRLENELITREMVDQAAESLLKENGR